jgi:metallo-beta-lactamase family protein
MHHPRLTFHGAAWWVKSSCFRLETDHGDILIDCRLFLGSKTEKELSYRPFPLVRCCQTNSNSSQLR